MKKGRMQSVPQAARCVIKEAHDISRRRFIRACVEAAAVGMVAPGVLAREEKADGHTGATARFEPAYLALHRSGELKRRGEALWERLAACDLCPRGCGVNRLKGEKGTCRATSELVIAAYHPHFGEEPPLVGRGGSGTIFFAHCSLRCVFCINWPISHGGDGKPGSLDDLAGMMIELQQRGCHNINVVTPTHYSAHILRALDRAAARGLRLPVVYNTCGWERLDVLRLMDGVVDIYLPDFKYADAQMATRHLGDSEGYPERTREALLEMHRQVGAARPGPDGLMRRGLMIRHLVMPNNAARTDEVLRWIGENLPRDTYVNVMSQYTPVHRAREFPEIARRLTRREYAQALAWAREAGLTQIEQQRMP